MNDNCTSKLVQDTHTYLNFIFKGMNNNILLRAISGDDTRTYYCKDLNEIPLQKLKDLNSEGYNIFIGLGTRISENGSKEHVSEISTLWVDLDVLEGDDRDLKLEKSVNICRGLGLEPSLINDSGNGYHFYFKFSDNIKIEGPEDIEKIESRLKWLKSKLSGDSATDVSRVLRVPGFNNNKNPKEPKLSSIIHINEEATYELSDFGTNTSNNVSIDRIELGDIPNEIPARFFELLESNTKLKNTWLGRRDDLEDTSGSSLDFSISSMLVRDDYTNEEIAKILTEAPYNKSQARTWAYLAHTISKARSNYEATKEIQIKIPSTHGGLADISLRANDFEDSSIEYLIDEFLPLNTLMLMTGSYGAGKSYFCLALAKKLISEGRTVVICDLDMPKHIIRGRLEDAGLLEYLGNKLHYIHSTNFPFKIHGKNDNWMEFKRLIEAENGAIVIFDNLKEIFPFGEDLNDDRKAIAVMNELKEVRDMLNTVLLLHHVTKDASSRHPFKNSGSIADTVDLAYYLERNDNECNLRCFKSRIPVKEHVKFTLDTNFSLHTEVTKKEEADLDNMIMVYRYMTQEQNKSRDFLQKDIIYDLSGKISRDKVRDTLVMGEGLLWKKTSGNKNSHIYKPIELNSQNSKNVPIYILKILGILETEDDELPAPHMSENLRG